MIDAYKYYENMEQNKIMLLFKGFINSELLSSILQITESKLDKIQEEPKIKKKIFNVLVECLQNVYHHIDRTESLNQDDQDIFDSAILMLGKNDSDYFIVTGNHVYSDKTEKLKCRLDELNGMSKEELKKAYEEVLTGQGFSEKGGAGLGLFDIMRKSGQKVDYLFHPIDNKFSFFTLKVKISNIKKEA